MATSGFIDSLFGGVEASLKRALKQAFSYVLDGNLRFGHAEHQTRAENFGMFFMTSTTSAVADAEFSVSHGMGRTPYLLMPVLPLDAVGSKTVRFEVSRAADGNRVYLKSPETNAPIAFLLE